MGNPMLAENLPRTGTGLVINIHGLISWGRAFMMIYFDQKSFLFFKSSVVD